MFEALMSNKVALGDFQEQRDRATFMARMYHACQIATTHDEAITTLKG